MAHNHDANLHYHVISESGYTVNQSRGIYTQSCVISVEKYICIIEKMEEQQSLDGPGSVSIAKVAKNEKVS